MLVTCPKCSARYQVPDEVELSQGKKLQCSSCQFIFKFQEFVQNKEQEDIALVPPEDAVLTAQSLPEKSVATEKKSSPPTESSFPEVFCPVSDENRNGVLLYLGLFLCCCFVALLSLVGWYYRDLLFVDTNFSWSNTEVYQRPLKKVLEKQKMALKKKVSFSAEKQKNDFTDAQSAEESFAVVSPVLEDVLVIQNSRFRVTSQSDNAAILIEGVLYNSSDQDVSLPEKLYATAYGEEGKVLFKKEIYLPQGILNAHQEQAFFGTYTPAQGRVQWIDVSLKQ